MDLITFWKHYGRELEALLFKAQEMESKRLAEAILQNNHYIIAGEKHNFERLITLKMITSVVIEMNRDEKIDGQKP